MASALRVNIKMTVNILGTEYKINIIERPDEDLFYAHADGRTNFDEKVITVWDNKKETERTIIHELIHAYLYESGLTIKTFDEDTVEYLTTMFINLEKITGDINESNSDS